MNSAPDGAAISPDGRQLAFDAYTDLTTEFDVHVANIDGSGVHSISSFAGQEGPPTWSPDGTLVVLAGSSNDLWRSIYAQPSSAAPTSTPRALTSFGPGADGSLNCPIIITNQQPVALSSTGALGFSCFGFEVDVLSPAGAVSGRYVPRATGSGRTFNTHQPVWSPDGIRVAFPRTESD